MKPLKIPPQLQQLYSSRFNDECEKITMSWNTELREWHPIALRALDFASVPSLNVPTKKYPELFKTEAQGINMNIVAALANNLENRSPAEMGYTAAQWREVVALNDKIGKYWNELTDPVHKVLRKEFEILMNKPKLIVAGEA